MHRIDAAGYAAGNLFTDGNPATGTPATVVDSAWLNDLQENIAQLIETAGISLVKGNYTQLIAALRAAGVFTTPAQFDNTTKAATTAFVQRALGGYAGYIFVSFNVALTAAQQGQVIEFASTSPITLTLPSATGIMGAAYYFSNPTIYDQTVSSASGFYGNTVGGATSFTVPHGVQGLYVVSDGTNWKVFNYTGANSLNANGYQKLSNGLIIQWGSGSTNSGGTLTQSFPITFPNGCLQQVAVGVETTLQTTLRYISCGNITNSQITVYAINSGAGIVLGVRWFAIGY